MSLNHKDAIPTPAGLLPIVKVLLTGMANHALKGRADDQHVYRTRIQKVINAMKDDVELEQAYPQAEEAVNALRDYGLRTEKRFHVRETELRAIVQSLMDTLKELRIATPERMLQFTEVANRLDSAREPEEIQLVHASLADSLAAIRKDAERDLPHAGDVIKDQATDLPGRTGAEAALAEACNGQAAMCAVIMMVDRLSLYNRRYGHDAGDRILRFFVDFVRRAFEEGFLFRWTGPAVLLLREGPLDKVQREVRRILEPRIEFDFETPSRTILLAIDACWCVLPMMVDPHLLINKIDAFVAS